MLGKLGSRDDYLCSTYIVIRDEYNTEEVIGNLIVIDNIANLVDQFYDEFGNGVTRSGFTTKHDCSCYYIISLFWSHSFDGDIAMDDIEDIHKLTFVLMYSFDLYIKHGILIDINRTDTFDPLN
jgi:hypothetical protein